MNGQPTMFRHNGFIRKGRILGLLTAGALGVMASGCALSRSTTSLNVLIEQEQGKKPADAYGYRCTIGAHRGASVDYKENTLAALKAANEDDRYAFIEFDVQYSRDNKIVVFHDKRLLRVFGSIRSIGKTTFDELFRLTEGEVCAYEDAMDVLTKKLNIEIKSQGDPEEDQQLADELIADIKARKRDDAIVISSISSDVIRYIHETYPDMATGEVFWLTSSTYLHFDRLTERFYERAAETHADYLMLHVVNLRNIEDLIRLKPRGKTIMFWTFDDTMYLVHKDVSDRLWGDSVIKAWGQLAKYRILSAFR